jgi:hypothetical protein
MGELERGGRVLAGYQKGDVFVLDMPNGETMRFRLDTEDERQRFWEVIEALPEEIRRIQLDKALASLGEGDILPAPIILPNGKALFIW